MGIEKLVWEIESLITARKEGGYWDFKLSHHSNKADFLLDIICMANNLADHDGYIIYGVDDDAKVHGVSNDSNRRSQQNIIDFLKQQKFGGGVRPTVELTNLIIQGMEVDVLIIENSTQTPFFIIDKYPDGKRTVRPYFIYTRIGDTNTSIDKSADINHIEYLWKKRFLLTRAPLDQITYKLRDRSEWHEAEYGYYNIYKPEYRIELEYDDYGRDKTEFYSFLMTNDSTTFGDLKILHMGTEIFKRQIVSLDSGRYLTVVPNWGFISFDLYHRDTNAYKFFIKDSLEFILHQFLQENNGEALDARRRFYEAVLIFESESERTMFEEYIQRSREQFLSRVQEALVNKRSTNDSRKHEDKKIAIGKVLVEMLEDFRWGSR